MEHAEPAVRLGRPCSPRIRDPTQLGRIADAAFDRLFREGRRRDPVCPQAAPPGAVAGCREAPHRCRRHDLGEAGGAAPGQQPATRIRLAAVGPGDLAVDRQPAVEQGIGPGTRSSPRSHCPARRRCHRDDRPGASRPGRRPAGPGAGGAGGRGRRRSCRPGTRARRHRRRRSAMATPAVAASARAVARGASARSTPTTRPGATMRARSMVIVPGPQPTSSRSWPARKVRQEVGRGVGGRPPAMRAQDALVVAVRVGLGRAGHAGQLGDGAGGAVGDGAGDDDGLADAPPAGLAPGFGSAARAAVARASSPVSTSNTSSPCR